MKVAQASSRSRNDRLERRHRPTLFAHGIDTNIRFSEIKPSGGVALSSGKMMFLWQTILPVCGDNGLVPMVLGCFSSRGNKLAARRMRGMFSRTRWWKSGSAALEEFRRSPRFLSRCVGEPSIRRAGISDAWLVRERGYWRPRMKRGSVDHRRRARRLRRLFNTSGKTLRRWWSSRCGASSPSRRSEQLWELTRRPLHRGIAMDFVSCAITSNSERVSSGGSRDE